MFTKVELETNKLYADLKIKDIAKKENKSNQDILDLCTLNLIKEATEENLKDFDFFTPILDGFQKKINATK